jgi:hypothetical protein
VADDRKLGIDQWLWERFGDSQAVASHSVTVQVLRVHRTRGPPTEAPPDSAAFLRYNCR